MKAHPHAEMIKAKADNMDLVLFSMSTGSDYGKWSECKRETMPKDNENIKYFLCLPKHKEACLHWLNGSDAQGKYSKTNAIHWEQIIDQDRLEWHVNSVWMSDSYDIRIKPRKEKRWIGFNKHTAITTSTLYKSIDDIKGATVRHEEWQFIEIEVEI